MNPVLTIDSQVHAYERDHPKRPWGEFLEESNDTSGWVPEVTGDDMCAAMDAVGVDAALLVSPFTMYGFDPSYALKVYAKHPRRFALIKPFDPASASVAEEIAEWAATPGVVGTRILLDEPACWSADHPGLNTVFAASKAHSLPLAVHASGHLPLLATLARQHPQTQVVLDHLGLTQPFAPPPPEKPFANLADVVALAELDNVAIKVSGVCTLSHQPFPYEDIWTPLMRIFESFGFERCLWGTDWTRAVDLLTYEQGVRAFTTTNQLSDSERTALMGGSLMKIYDWRPSTGSRHRDTNALARE